MDDLKTIIEYHEQMLRSLESQLGHVIEGLDRMREERREAERRMDRAERRMDRAERRMDRAEAYMQRAFRMGVSAIRRERKTRLEADQRLEAQREADRKEWQERHARIERLLERSNRGQNGSSPDSPAG